MKVLSVKHNNNYSIACEIFDEILNWAANKTPKYTKQQVCAQLEKVLDKVEDKDGFYKKGYDRGYRDCEIDNKQ